MRLLGQKKKRSTKKKSGGSWVSLVFASLWRFLKALWWMLKTPWALIVLALIAIFVWAMYIDLPHKAQQFAQELGVDISSSMGLVVENVYLEGQRHTKTEKILEVLDVKIGQPLLSVPLNEIRARLQKLPWVRYAVVERQYPSTLSVHILERIPVALWQYDQKIRLIDSEGQVILADDLAPFSDLVIIVGKDIPLYLQNIMDMLESEEALRSLVSSIVRVGDRRWNIRLHNGIEIRLPESKAEAAWSYLAQLHNEKNMLNDETISVIDLRVSDKLYIERDEKERDRKGHSA